MFFAISERLVLPKINAHGARKSRVQKINAPDLVWYIDFGLPMPWVHCFWFADTPRCIDFWITEIHRNAWYMDFGPLQCLGALTCIWVQFLQLQSDHEAEDRLACDEQGDNDDDDYEEDLGQSHRLLCKMFLISDGDATRCPSSLLSLVAAASVNMVVDGSYFGCGG